MSGFFRKLERTYKKDLGQPLENSAKELLANYIEKNWKPEESAPKVEQNKKSAANSIKENLISLPQVLHENVSRFDSLFDNSSVIGEGGFGTVYKAKHRIDGQIYAIKKIDITNNDKVKCTEEVEKLAKLKSDQVVNYITSWLDDNYIYIQMEFCSTNLSEIIAQKSQYFERQDSEVIKREEYYICCEIFKEILECVYYLHNELEPPLIHLDIKPQNILFCERNKNGKYIKLCDLGLSVFQELSTFSVSNAKGTQFYMAPEVKPGSNGKGQLSLKADIYSLGITATDLLAFDINSSDNIPINDEIMDKKLFAWTQMIGKMLSYNHRWRPTCAELLDNAKEWVIDRKDIQIRPKSFENFKNKTSKLFYDYLIHKFN